MSYWNYRIMRRYHEESETETFHIHEVYYSDDHKIEAWTASEIAPMGETLSELKEDIEFMAKALDGPVLVEKTESGKEILVEYAADAD